MSFARHPSLSGRVVFVTGGASGIGADIVRAFAEQDARVAFVDIQDEAAQALVEDLAPSLYKPLFLYCDLHDIEALRAAIGAVRDQIGPIGVLVNNAANDDRHAVADVTPEYWDRAQNVNLRHQFFAAQAAQPHMRELGGGSIINFSSIAWRGGGGNMPAYATAKAAVVGLTNSLARAFGADNIRVNAIEPGAVITERQRQLWYPTQEAVNAFVERQCIKKVLEGDAIARMVLFLASDDSQMITKQSFVVDAGLL
ncbi:MAG TPA: SDR family oxidoreductase [Ramlibacter sp.]|jgi:NAD(P)-dependent dehydrogenase (short-subunit alcohol dehydrogenase family)